MVRKEKQKPISTVFVVIFVITVIAMLTYAFTPNEIKKIKSKKNFEEMLEYNHRFSRGAILEQGQQTQPVVKTVVSSEDYKIKQPPAASYEQEYSPRVVTQPQIEEVANDNTIVYAKQTKQSYNDLLDNLKMYPSRSLDTINLVVNKLLEYKGYPQNTVNVLEAEAVKNVQIKGSYIAAYFDFQSGAMYIDKNRLFALKKEEVIAILAHELDHFDKLACICKSMGVSSFVSKLQESGLANTDYSFWSRASEKADLTSLDVKKYQEALFRYIEQNSIDLVSSYSDFYRMSENIRNPLEISAYEASDYILSYYGLPHNEGSTYKLVSKFNDVDWAIYNLINSYSSLTDERITFFDYFFMKAIVDSNPKYKNAFDNCINNKNGDLSEFWLSFEQDNMSFYDKKLQVTAQTYSTMYSLLSRTQEHTKSGLDSQIVMDALKYKVNTLRSNIVYPNAIKNIEKAIISYFEYKKQNDSGNSKQDLEFLLTLLCIENQFYKSNSANEISLYYIKIPEKISKYEYIKDRKTLLKYVYGNSYFKELFEEEKNQNPSALEQNLLVRLLNDFRLDVRVKL